MEKLYTVIYAFMTMILGLKGLVRDTFGVIFGFWLGARRTSSWVSYTTITKLTGGSRPAIIAAVKTLEDYQLIKVERCPGKVNRYTVTLDDSIMNDFDATFGAGPEPVNRLSGPIPIVKPPDYHQEPEITRTRNVSCPRILKNKKNKNNNYIKVSNAVITGGLPEA